MADFLTRLASRTLGLTPAAEPVVAPLFAQEPASWDAFEAGESPASRQSAPALPGVTGGPAVVQAAPRLELPPAMASQASDGGSPAIVRPTPPAGPSQPGALVQGEGAADPGAGRRAEDRLVAQEPPSLSFRQGVRVEASEASLLLRPLHEGAQDSLPPGAAAPGVVAPAAGVRRPTARPAAEDDAAASLRGSAAVERSPAAVAHSTPAVRGEAGAAWNDAAMEPLLLAPFDFGVAEPRSLRPARQGASHPATPAGRAAPVRGPERGAADATVSPAPPPAPPPAIEITIGRVEVRAVQRPAPPPRPAPAAPPAPRLSLEEYLQNQSEGRR